MRDASPDALQDLALRSIEVIAAHQDAGGAYIASPAFPVYRYSWLRDGAFIADAMSRAGSHESADRFFRWCAQTVTARREHVASLLAKAARGETIGRSEHLPTRFTVDGADTGEEWWDFQLDGYGTWMWALAAHLSRSPASAASLAESALVVEAVGLCSDYLCTFWAQPCFDWWEEHPEDVHVSTLGCIAAGLRAALAAPGRLRVSGPRARRCAETVASIEVRIRERGVIDGHLVKSLDGDDRVDASLIALCTPMGFLDPFGEVAEHTYAAIVRDLAPDGVHRYLGDTYYGGGRWVVLAGFVGAHEAATGRRDLAMQRLAWMQAQATPDGLLPEQVSTEVLDPSFVPVWEAKWGPIATPLLWSHAMYLTLADELGLLEGIRR